MATAYLRVAPERRGDRIVGAKVTGMTLTPPAPSTGHIAVRVSVSVPTVTFGPFIPSAVLMLPEPMEPDIEIDPTGLVER